MEQTITPTGADYRLGSVDIREDYSDIIRDIKIAKLIVEINTDAATTMLDQFGLDLSDVI